MPALNFKRQFAAQVRSGAKTLTIRAPRRYPIRQGDRLVLYTGMRTSHCEKLLETVCHTAQTIRIAEHGVAVDGVALPQAAVRDLAIADGFGSVSELQAFFREIHGLPFDGQVIQWQ